MGKEGLARRDRDVGRRRVDEMKATVKKCLKIDAVAKSGDNRRVRASGKGVGDPEGRSNEVLNNDSPWRVNQGRG